MAALTASRLHRPRKIGSISLPHVNEQTYKGGVACMKANAAGLVTKSQAATDLVPIGVYAVDTLVTGNASVSIRLFDEITAMWMANASGGDAVAAANIGGLCYLHDDQTVGVDDDTNTKSVAGRIWGYNSTTNQVLVQFRNPNGSQLTGLDA